MKSFSPIGILLTMSSRPSQNSLLVFSFQPLVEKIKLLLNLHRTSITRIRRSQSKVSNCLVLFARVEGRTMTCLGSGLPSVIELNNVDCNPPVI
jgi:hypothetical protein